MLPINGLSERMVRMRIEQRLQRDAAHLRAVLALGARLETNGLSKDDVFSLSPETTGYHIALQTRAGIERLSQKECDEYITHLAGRKIDAGYDLVALLTRNGTIIDLSSAGSPVSAFIENFFSPSREALKQEVQFQKYVEQARRDPEWYTRPPGFSLPHAWSEKPDDFTASPAYFLERIRDERLVDMMRAGVRSKD